MTSPSQPDPGLTYEEALALVAAAAAAQTPAAVAQSITAAMSSAVAAARDTALQWASALIFGRWRDVNVYDGSAVQAFTEDAGEYMAEAQTVVATTAAAAQVQILATMGIDDVPFDIADPVDVRGTPVIDEGGTVTVERNHASTVDYTDGGRHVVDLDEDASTVGIFNRPARTQRYLESQGMGSEEARAQAEQRMLTLVDGNLMLAQRLAEAEILARAASMDERVIGIRRVIHPELSRTGTCGLCIAASDRIYSVRELVPIHGRCQCTTAAVTEEFDPADALNAVDLLMLYDNAGDSTNGAALKATRYKVNEHGELGLVLAPAKRRKAAKGTSTTPIAPARESQADIAARHLPQLEMSLAGLRAGGLSDDSSQVRYHEQQIAKYRDVLSQAAPEPAVGGGGGGDDGGNGGGGDRSWAAGGSDDPRLTEAVRKHILDGDNRGGGHRSTSTRPNKTLFPSRWSDDDAIAAVNRALVSPYTTSDDHADLVDPNFLNHYGFVDGVRLAVRLNKASGGVETAHPLDGDGVFRTGKKDGTTRKPLPLGSVRNVPLPDGPD